MQTSEEVEAEAVEEVDPARQAVAEGLTLQPAPGTITGWKGVKQKGKRFEARFFDAEAKRQRHLGSFATAEQVMLPKEHMVVGRSDRDARRQLRCALA